MAEKQAAPIAGQTAQSGPQALSDAPAPATAGVPGAVLNDTAPGANGSNTQLPAPSDAPTLVAVPLASTGVAAVQGLDEIQPGGKFIVNGVTVDAEGRPIKK